MTTEKALRIKELRTNGSTYRSIAQVIEREFPQFPDLAGNQLHGEGLVYDAMEFLYEKAIPDIDDEIRLQWFT